MRPRITTNRFMSSLAPPTPVPSACQIARVISVLDPEQQARVKVQLPAVAGEAQAEVWARVAAPFASPDRGATSVPDVDDEVLVTFVSGDARFPVVLGGLWNGSKIPPTKLASTRVAHQEITSKAGTKISIVEESGSPESIVLETPQGVRATFTGLAGGIVRIANSSGNTITLNSAGIALEAAAKVTVTASQVEITAAMVTVEAGQAQFSGIVKCDVLQANSVIAASYSPGAGNVW
jgi:uncharacterized protein involved in type VI secretion and phage assembly